MHASEFWSIRVWESERQAVRRPECRTRDRENPNRRGKGSTLTCIGFRGFEN
jgi:hypothetical protein